ncbi:LOW QUALITY PROTEIN: ATP-dependent translocase ABCB1-like [Pecten maximus]|uniref:LOW QUALITY PROTEIN: ATP-dependent translocase ABCB1-like n=1 Tax=Pecten maximus TaxID=6579 RepID=UPI0014580F7D|nr:LOW QUALITY PROTEIN: ATP-dependent translocase ABCB1-like [Pecten maximus]
MSSEVTMDGDANVSEEKVNSNTEVVIVPDEQLIDKKQQNGDTKQQNSDTKQQNGDSKQQNGDNSSSGEEKEDEKEKETPTVGAFEIFKFSDKWDKLMMILGVIGATAHGLALPCLIIIFGEMTDSFVDSGKYANILTEISAFLASIGITRDQALKAPTLLLPYLTDIQANYSTVDTTVIQKQATNDFLKDMETFAIYYIGIAGGVLLCGYFQVAFWILASERQIHRIRKLFFRNIMRQDIGWFDTHETGELNTRLTDDINQIHEGIGDKVSTFIQWFSSAISSFIIGFIYGWQLTLVMLSVAPLLALAAGVMSKIMASMSTKELTAYAKAGAVAEEVLSSIRTVVAFGGERKECKRYNEHLSEARDIGVTKSLGNGLSFGVTYMLIFLTDCLGFWYGAKLTRDQPDLYTPGKILIVFFSIVIGAFALGNAMPNLQAISTARGAAYMIYNLIALEPAIDSSSEEGKKPGSIEGTIKFQKVKFRYPAREEVVVLDGIDLDVGKGQTVALVGSSGCGKSTVVQLLQRFYDPQEGQIMIDDVDIKELNLKWLRQHIGIVSQEPILFATTIAENIRYGREGVTDREIEDAAKMANAHNFIMDLPEKYSTLVGERGAQLSGGQKQRVAIARALVRDPRILLLDEATSALDTESEAVVQEALDKARAGRTTLVIAHRLSTIKTADSIAGFKNGVVAERGTHDQLMQKDGVYSKLVKLQTKSSEKGNNLSEKKAQEHKVQHKIGGIDADDDKDTDEEKKKEENKGSFRRIMRLNAPEWHFILIGCIGSIMFGAVQPAFAIIFASILDAFASSDENYQKQEINRFVIILAAIAVGSLIALTLQGYMFGKSGEILTMRIRSLSFKAMLRQEIAYFDDHKNNTGALTTRLATEASDVKGASGARMGKLLENIANMGTAIIISFIYGWQLTLVIIAFIPIIAAGGALEFQLLSGVAGKNKEALEGAGKVASEGIGNIRTVAALTKEDAFFRLYTESLKAPYKASKRKAHLIGMAFSFSQSVVYFLHAAAFYYGAYLVREGEMDFDDVFKVFAAIVFGAMAMGNASAFAPDASKAQVAAGHIFTLLDRVPSIDSESDDGVKPNDEHFTSKVTFKNVQFRYPTRPDIQVLQGLNLSVEPGQTLALVGTSGCGKSTTVQLIERFYDPEDGSVVLDKHDVKDMNIHWLRSQIGIVSQEPVLFDCSIAENIAYGDNTRVVPMSEIMEAARKSNIHQFIDALPGGYDTNVGSKGTQLSGGQKQRVAIARALVRNPKILLLDEATSALDTESEKVVQEALDKAREGRTSIVIAHRLSTIRNADKICVIKAGKVEEEGRHGDLMSKQGIYFKLNSAQAGQS